MSAPHTRRPRPCVRLPVTRGPSRSCNPSYLSECNYKVCDMTTKPAHDSPILVTGAAGAVGAIGRNLTAMLLAKGHKVRALVRREDERAGALRHHGVEAFVNMSQMTVTQMSITETTDSPQHKLHWLAEQALSWSGLAVVTVRPTVFLEGFFLLFAAASVRDADELALPMGASKTSPVSSVDVARAVAAILDDPAPHIGHIYNLTGPESADLDHYARVFSEALGRTIRYRDAPTSEWSEKLRAAGLPEHVVHHLTVMTELHKQGRYDRMSEDYLKLTGETPTSMADFVKLHAAEFTRSEATV